ncbi:MAG: 2'-5' RNA ligase family protein, partial [Boseongicola sp.]
SQPRAVWLGVTPSEPLEMLHKKLVRHALVVGFEVPKRKYVPHLTLARFSPSGSREAELAGLFEKNVELDSKPFQPQTMALYQSMLGREAPRYDELYSFSIKPI